MHNVISRDTQRERCARAYISASQVEAKRVQEEADMRLEESDERDVELARLRGCKL